MAVTEFAATAATCQVVPGTEQPAGEGMLRIKAQAFIDVIESPDSRIAGTNNPILDLHFNPTSGDGELEGTFTLKPTAINGTWEGEMRGQFVKGMVTAWGIARGTGALKGSVLRIDFQQVAEYPGEAPCENPKAYYDMKGLVLK